jgi:hypothetical protein
MFADFAAPSYPTWTIKSNRFKNLRPVFSACKYKLQPLHTPGLPECYCSNRLCLQHFETILYTANGCLAAVQGAAAHVSIFFSIR